MPAANDTFYEVDPFYEWQEEVQSVLQQIVRRATEANAPARDPPPAKTPETSEASATEPTKENSHD